MDMYIYNTRVAIFMTLKCINFIMQGSFCGVWLYIKYAKIMT